MYTENNQKLSERLIRVRTGAYDMIVNAEPDESLRIDCEGRWFSLRQAETFYRRLMDGGVVRYRYTGDEPQPVDAPEAIHGLARALAERFAAALVHGEGPIELRGSVTDRQDVLGRLANVQSWTAGRWTEWARRFNEVYPEAVEILPPDRYQDLVVQPAMGCPNGKCSFCAFYQDRDFRILASDDFERHIEGIKNLLGQAIHLRDGIFLGSANALAISQRTLIERLQRIKEALGLRKRQIAAFWDPDHTPTRTVEDWCALKMHELVSVYTGLETGMPALRKKLGKSDRIERFHQAVAMLKQSGMGLSVIVLVGVGGEAYRLAHRAATVDLLQTLPWTRGDRIYLSPLAEGLPQPSMHEELACFTRVLRDSVAAKVAPYHINRFCYFA